MSEVVATRIGRPAGEARGLLLQALPMAGDFEALARHTGLPERTVQQTLWNLRRDRVIEAVAKVVGPTGRRRAVYAPALPREDAGQALGLLLGTAWR
jgi:hypothetical protein